MNLTKRCACPGGACSHPFWFRFQHEGRTFRGTTKTANRVRAGRIANKKQIEILEGRAVKASAVRLAVHVADYLEWARKDHPATADLKDARVLREFQEEVGIKRVDQVVPFDIERWRARRSKEVKRPTVDRELVVVKSLFRRAVEWGRVVSNPAAKVRPYGGDEPRIRVFSAGEISTITNKAERRIALICRVTLESLPRLSEVLGILPDHIGPSWVEMRRKGGKVERVQVSPELREKLIAAVPFNWSENAASIAIRREFKRLGIRGASHHTCRHTGVTLMLEAGINPRVIQRLAGWSSLRMLERYGHARDAEAARAVAATHEIIESSRKSSQQVVVESIPSA